MSQEIVDLIQKQGENHEAFKKANDERLARIEKGLPTGDIDTTIKSINDELKRLADENRELQKRTGRAAVEKAVDSLTPEQKDYHEGLSRYMRSGDESGLKGLQQKAMMTGSDPDGGYLVLPEMDTAIDRVAETMSAMYRLARVVNIGSAKWEKLVKTSGLSMRRVNEGATGGESTNPKYSKVEIEAFEAEVEPWVYNATLQDAMIDLEADLAMEAGIGFGEGAGAEFITGNGVGKARGITGYSNVANSAYAWGSVGYIATGKSAAFASVAPGDAVIQLQHALRSQYRNGAVFLMNDATLGTMRQLKDGAGNYYLWTPDPAAGFGGRFLGAPVEIDDNMPNIAAGAYSVAFGNFARAYAIVQRAGTALIRDNITAKGTTKFNFRRRFGGGVTQFEAVKLMKFATS